MVGNRNFNSIKVQLEFYGTVLNPKGWDYFNSIKVQLELENN